MREILLVLAGVVLVLGMFVNWLKCPRIKLTVFNETADAIYDVRVSFLSGERTAERIEPGRFAFTEIESGGSAGIFISYRDSAGIVKKDRPVYYSKERGTLDRGFVEVHLKREGTRVVNGVYSAFDIPILTIHVEPTGSMTVK